MAEEKKKMGRLYRPLLAIFVVLLQAFSFANAQSFIGVNYGQVADNLPPASVTASLLQFTTISKLRLYGADPAILRAFAGTNISLVVGVSNADVASFASDPSAAANWASANLLPFLPATTISVVSVGNEALKSSDASLAPLVLPAMKNLRAALAASPAAAGIKVSTVHSMAVMSASAPPSAGMFDPDLTETLTRILGFLSDTGSPFMINPYPFFAYRDDPRPETLAFCLFQPNPGRFDTGSGINYTNMFDAQVDAIRSALDRMGFKDVEIVVAETGWPYKGDAGEVGTTVENAQAFIGGLVSHLRSMVGTPKMPGRSVDTYIFALYDEDLKPGPTSERSFGIYKADGTANYDAGLTRTASTPSPTQGITVAPVIASSPPPSISPPPPAISPPAPTLWCPPGAVLQASNDGRRCYVPGAVGSTGARTVELSLFTYVVLALLLLSYVI